MFTFKFFLKHLRLRVRQIYLLRKYRIENPKEQWFAPHSKLNSHNPVILIICGFGPKKYQDALIRLTQQAETLGVFTKIYGFGNLNEVPGLDLELKSNIEKMAYEYKRGWGLWSWKAPVILSIMKTMPEDAEIFYLDVGCEISCQGKERFNYYREILNKKGCVFSSIPYLEHEWTNGEVLNYFKLPENEKSHQIQATWLGIKNTRKMKHLIREWAHICNLDNGRLLKNLNGSSQNKHLIDHREDQSILSCLIKSRYKIDPIPHEDHFSPHLYSPGSWVLRIPIHTLRVTGNLSIINPLISKKISTIFKVI